MHYLSPSNFSILPAYRQFFGLFETMGSLHNLLAYEWDLWGMDNGRFNQKAKPGDADTVNPKWDEATWLKMLDFYDVENRATCKFCLVPDVPYRSGETLELYHHYLPAVTGRGYVPGLALQDGMVVDDIPWNDVGAIFVGGSTEWKLSHAAAVLALHAQRLGKWVHVGRVNSIKRMKLVWWADSVDGRMLVFNSGIDRQRVLAEGVSFCRHKKRLRRLI